MPQSFARQFKTLSRPSTTVAYREKSNLDTGRAAAPQRYSPHCIHLTCYVLAARGRPSMYRAPESAPMLLRWHFPGARTPAVGALRRVPRLTIRDLAVITMRLNGVRIVYSNIKH